MIGHGPISCLLGHVNGLLVYLDVKFFLLSIFNFVDFLSSMSCIMLDIELADIKLIKLLGNSVDGKFQAYSLRPRKKYKRTKQAY